MKKYSNTLLILLFIFLMACSPSDESQGVVSANDLSSDTTVTTIEEETAEVVVSVEDAQLLLAKCLREKGLNVPDPSQQEPKVDLSGLKESRDDIMPLLQECGWQK